MTISNNKNVLIGFAEALSTPEVIWCLTGAGFHVIAFTNSSGNIPLHRLKNIELIPVTPLRVDAARTLEDIRNIYKDRGASAILPLNDNALWLCSKLSEDPQINIAGPTNVCAQFSLDKRIQIKAAQDSGFNVPKTQILENITDADGVDEFPIIVKSALAVAELNGKPIEKESVLYCKDKQEFDKAISLWSKKQPLLVQKIHSGIGEGLFGFASEKDISFWTAHQRIRMMNPKGSGASACRSIPVMDHPVESAKRMLSALKWRGLFMIELLRDTDGKLWFIEVNGRCWGSMALALRMGYDYPAWTVMQKLDPTFYPVKPAPRDYVVCRHLGRELIHILQVLRGPSSDAIPNWPPFWKSLFNVLHFRKSDCWYNSRNGQLGFFIADTFNTIMNETLRKWI